MVLKAFLTARHIPFSQFGAGFGPSPFCGTLTAATIDGLIMTSERFSECLLHIRWTPINIASALQCELSWIESMEAGNEEIPNVLAVARNTGSSPRSASAANDLSRPESIGVTSETA
ncbi:hypothetical protein GGE48_005631 [Rhizobium leguminosarum]|nr:hypothetical protein [Rhizobium leguminosarum]